MSTEEVGAAEHTAVAPDEDDDAAASHQDGAGAPSWWHREHPVFTSLAGFFTGMLFIILVPGLYGAVLSLLVDDTTAESLFPFVLVALAVPIGLLVAPRTRRFGRYMTLGIVSTVVVVGVVAAAVLWYLVKYRA